jgi:pimeloyl-ACP methyl ester carboxylesterase
MLDTVLHRWLRVPYTLKVRYIQRPKKPIATLLFIHGLGNTGAAWDEVIALLPNDVRIISIDLLGFGRSPRPDWALYNAKDQARAVLATLLKLRITTPVTVVGHSLGALVAIEMATRYPLLIKKLILCSPPLYSDKNPLLPSPDKLLRQLYTAAENNPGTFLRVASLAAKYKLLNASFNLSADNIDTYMLALGSMIINQTSLHDAYQLKVPTTIVRGTLDPVVVTANLNKLAKANPDITIKKVIAGHEVKGRYVRIIANIIKDDLVRTVEM